MIVKDFNISLMTTKVVFQPDKIKAGSVIKIYKVDATANINTEAKHSVTGIIVEVDHIMIRYSYYSASSGEMKTAYLYAGDVFVETATEEQWEGKENLYLFEV